MTDTIKPSLSADGWITSSSLKLDDLLADFYYAEYSQTAVFPGHVASLPYIIQNNRNDPTATAAAVDRTLRSYLDRYFDTVSVSCTASFDDPTPNKAAIKIFVEVIDKAGVTQTASTLLHFLNSKFQAAVNLNNG